MVLPPAAAGARANAIAQPNGKTRDNEKNAVPQENKVSGAVGG